MTALRIVNQNQIIEAEMPGERARLRRHAFLHATVARQTNHMLIENPVLGGVETRRRHFACHRDADRVADALAERTGRAFDARRFKKFRMARRLGMQLPETLDLRHRQIVAAHVQPGVKEHAAVTGRENEIVATDPARLFGIMFERVTVKDRAHFRATERQTKMTGLRRLHRIHGQAARFGRRARESFKIHFHSVL